MRLLAVAAPRRPCPLCAGWRARIIWREGSYDYLRCRRCRIVFSNLSAEEYETTRHNMWDEARPTEETIAFYGEARREAHRQFLEHCQPAGQGRMLDVGSGLGFFLERARRAGWDVTGCDTSPGWVAIARRRIEADRVVLGGVDAPELSGLRFDLVTAWDVVEHVFDPVPFLRRLADMMTSQGRLFLRTPNFAYVGPLYALRQSLLRQSWATLGPTNHVVYFTAATMARALDAAGLRPVSWRIYPPPQVAVSADPRRRVRDNPAMSVKAKNLYGRTTSRLAVASSGRVVVGSDLDVLAVKR